MSFDIGNMVEVKLAAPDDFLKVKETLTRIGVPSKKENILYQSCHILHKQGRYFVVHFKELFALDGKPTNFDQQDIARRNRIATLLSDWGLVGLVNSEIVADPIAPISQIKIIPYKDKVDWTLMTKYNIGKRKN